MFSGKHSFFFLFFLLFILLFGQSGQCSAYTPEQNKVGISISASEHSARYFAFNPSELNIASQSKIKLERTRRKILENSPCLSFVSEISFFFFTTGTLHFPVRTGTAQANTSDSLIRGPPATI
ncbi:MAG TPA: hypothetical protein VNZ86_15710 [Bacteroidia bacterium]|jgi:hypothetical protein|nr:hypothetical protein [Bacteroidia bacterium]